MSAGAATQNAPITTSRPSYLPTSSLENDDRYYRNQIIANASNTTQARHQRRQHGRGDSSNSPISQQQYYISNPAENSRYAYDGENPVASSPGFATNIPIHTRQQSTLSDQYDGPAPTIPARNSSQQSPALVTTINTPPSDSRASTSRRTRQEGSQNQQNTKYDSQGRAVRSQDPTAARARRRGPGSPDAPQNVTTYHEAATSGAGPTRPDVPRRENSEVINRVVVSDPQVDAERLQERVAEAQPMPMSVETTPNSGLGLAENGSVDNSGRGPQRRQDYSKSASRRKDVQFGDYVLGQTLGEGEFGKVKLGWKKDGSTQVAIKLIRRETVANNPNRLPKIYREISILRDLAHPNIVRLHEMVETERHIGIILEYASGGELFDYILNNRYLKDPAARRLFAQLVSGVGYLHKKGIVHRDLKLENLLLDQNKNIIITDFGFANTFDAADVLSDEIEYNLGNKDFVRKYRLDRQDERGMRKGDLMQTSCGSPCYAAPELVVSDSLYTGRKVDVWSCGVILVRSFMCFVNHAYRTSMLCWLATCLLTTTLQTLREIISTFCTSTSPPRL